MKQIEDVKFKWNTIKKSVRDVIKASVIEDMKNEYKLDKNADIDIKDLIAKLTDEMLAHAASMEFEKAAELRDKIKELENMNS